MVAGHKTVQKKKHKLSPDST